MEPHELQLLERVEIHLRNGTLVVGAVKHLVLQVWGASDEEPRTIQLRDVCNLHVLTPRPIQRENV